jgi:hypothetical protein
VTQPLTTQDAVAAALLRPLTTVEAGYADTLIEQVSAQLRNKLRNIDARIAAYALNPADPAGIDPDAVAAMLANVIKRTMVNPSGAASTSNTTGPWGQSLTFRSYHDSDAGLLVTDDDVAAVLPGMASGFVMPGTIRTRPRLEDDCGFPVR